MVQFSDWLPYEFPVRPIRLGSTQQSVRLCSQIPVAGCVQGNRLSPGRVISVHCSVAHSPKTELKAALEMKWVLSQHLDFACQGSAWGLA